MPRDLAAFSIPADATTLTDQQAAHALSEAWVSSRVDLIDAVARLRPDYLSRWPHAHGFVETSIDRGWHEGLAAFLRGLRAPLVDGLGRDALIIAATCHEPRCARAALPFCDPTARTASGRTALHMSLGSSTGILHAEEQAEVIRALAPVSDLSQTDPNGYDAFALAVRHEHNLDHARILAPFVPDPSAALSMLSEWHQGDGHDELYDAALVDELGRRVEMTPARIEWFEELALTQLKADVASALPKTFAAIEAFLLRGAIAIDAPGVAAGAPSAEPAAAALRL
jgi:hypothetical protein